MTEYGWEGTNDQRGSQNSHHSMAAHSRRYLCQEGRAGQVEYPRQGQGDRVGVAELLRPQLVWEQGREDPNKDSTATPRQQSAYSSYERC